MKATVTINGTDTNPWSRYGLRCNPFPQHGRKELAAMDHALADLDADPIPDAAALRQLLERQGWVPEFIDGCVERYRPGQRVRFDITWPDEEEA